MFHKIPFSGVGEARDIRWVPFCVTKGSTDGEIDK